MAAQGLYEDGKNGIRRLTEPDLRIKDQDLDGVVGEVMFGILGGAARLNDPEASIVMMQIYNDWLAEFCSAYPDRLAGLASIPGHDIEAAVAEIERGNADVIIAGGSDSTSNAPLTLSENVIRTLGPVVMGKSGPMDYLQVAAKLAPFTDFIPKMPQIAERSTGEVMGEAADRMATRNGISREAQDAFTVQSHHRAAAAVASGRFTDEVVPVDTPKGKVYADTLIRAETSVEKLARLRPVFAKGGSVTAGNASPLTDGASAVLIMEASKAKALGLTAKAAFRSWAYVGVDPADQLLMGPALAMPKALQRAGLDLGSVDLVDMHEAFAAQVLSIVKMLGSDAFAQARLGLEHAVGEIDPARFNVHGGSLSIGHPFGATGARMVTTMANELVLGDKQTALLGICAAGGLGAAAVLERVG